MRLDPLKCTCWGYYISALRGCCTLIFLHALEIDQGYLAHTPSGAVVPQNFNRENLKFGLKFSLLESILNNFRSSGIIHMKLFQSTCLETGVIKWVQILKGRPQKFEKAKNRPKFNAIFVNFRLWSPISPEQIDTSKIGKALENLQPLSRWMKKVCVGLLRSTNDKVISSNKFTP